MGRFRMLKTSLVYDAERYSIKTFKSLIRNLLFHSGYVALLIYRFQDFFTFSERSFIARWISVMNFRISGCEFIPGCKLGPGALIPHPSGIVIGKNVVIGEGCTLMQNVTLGQQSFSVEAGGSSSPSIGRDVCIGAGSMILGDVRIGDFCIVGAMSLVLESFPSNSIIIGNPARLVSNP